jgi:hypothetical protein
MIDAGNPAAPGVGSLDFDGDPRALDATPHCTGNVARRDIGADEFVPGSIDCTAPGTTLSSKIKRKKRRATFTFGSTEAGSHFQCKLDRKPFAPCSSPKTYRKLKRRKHTFQVRAIDAAGNVDATPAVKKFKIPQRRHH